MTVDEISAIVLREAVAIHRELGPGLFESVYQTVLAGRLEAADLRIARQLPVPITFDGHDFEAAFKVDILVEDQLILEIKSVDQLARIHAKQLLT